MRIRYIDPLERLEFELRQLRENNINVDVEQIRLKELQEFPDDDYDNIVKPGAMSILINLNQRFLPGSADEPDAWQEIVAACPGFSTSNSGFAIPSDDILLNRILGGWLGRSAGCLLGKPVEKYARPVIREILESNNQWPLDNYFTAEGMPTDILAKYPWKQRGGFASLRENIREMPEDDDLNYTMLNLHVLEKYGYAFNSINVGNEWLQLLPVFETFTAERVAYFNLLNGLVPPTSGSYCNPFREWIGAQIRADIWGYACPGDPARAAELAWRDGRLSHTGNGLYGEIFFAAMIAAAFTEQDPLKLVETSLLFVPRESRFSQAIRTTLAIVQSEADWEKVVDRLEAEFGHYHWVHTINNAALTVAALVYGANNYERTICCAVMGGWDTDCNGATAGSVLGVILGANDLPDKWISPLQNRIRSSLKGFDGSAIADLARRTVQVIQHSEPDCRAQFTKNDDF